MGKRFAIAIGVAALGAAVIATGASADFRRVNDPRGDARCHHETGQHGPCSAKSRRNADIVRATAGHGKNGRLKHTIRVVGKVQHVRLAIQTRPTPACVRGEPWGLYQVDIRRGRPGKVRPCLLNKSTGRARYDFHRHSVEISFSERSIGNPQSYRWSAFATDGGCPDNDCVGSAPRRTSPHADDVVPNRRDYIRHRLGDSGVAATGVMAFGAQTAASAGVHKYDTTVTIRGEFGDFTSHAEGIYGDVTPRRCAYLPRVVAFKQRPGADRRLGADRGNVDGDWEVRFPEGTLHGGDRVYARVKRWETDRYTCRADRSRAVTWPNV